MAASSLMGCSSSLPTDVLDLGLSCQSCATVNDTFYQKKAIVCDGTVVLKEDLPLRRY